MLVGQVWRIFLFTEQGMKDTQARRAEKTIRTNIPMALYPKLAFLAAQAGISVPALVRGTVIARIAELALVFREGVGPVDHEPAAVEDHSAGDDRHLDVEDEVLDHIVLPGDRGADVEHDPLDDL